MKLVTTAEGYQYWIPDAQEAEGNPLYSPQPQYNENTKSFALPVADDDVSDLPTFKIQNLGKSKDKRPKEEKLAEMFGVVPGPEGPLDIVKSFVSGLTAPGEVAKGEVETGDMLSRAIDTAGLGVTGPLAMKPGTASLGSGMTRRMNEWSNKAKELFGTTNNPKEAGYVMPDGSMLDLSGRHQDLQTYQRVGDKFIPKPGQKDYNLNQRQVDHTEVAFIYPDDVKPSEGLKLRDKFLTDTGGLRNNPGIGFETHYIPTPQQLKTIVSNHVRTYPGAPLSIDVVIPGTNKMIAYKTFDKPNIETINKWFKEQAKDHPDIKLFSDTSDVGKAISVAQQVKPFFTNVEASLAKIPMKSGTAEQWTNAFKRYGAGKEELQYTIGELPKGQITRAQIEQHIKDNAVQLNEVWKGENTNVGKLKAKRDAEGRGFWEIRNEQGNFITNVIDNFNMSEAEAIAEAIAEANARLDHGQVNRIKPKYSQYQMPGGTNYRELLLTTPHTPRDMVKPSDAASAKYLPEWNRLVEERRRLQPLVDDYDRRLTGEAWEKAKSDFVAVNKKMDELHEKMVDDTIAASNGRLGGQAYKSSHWDEPNVIAHVRMNDRTIPVEGRLSVSEIEDKVSKATGIPVKSMASGTPELAVARKIITPEEAADWSTAKGYINKFQNKKGQDLKSLHLEEIQSDWHQAGRKQGYKVSNAQTEAWKKELEIIQAERAKLVSDPDPVARARYDALSKREIEVIDLYNRHHDALPDAPFKNNWDELALKKAIRIAVEEGRKIEIANWDKIVQTKPEKLADALAAKGVLKKVCD